MRETYPSDLKREQFKEIRSLLESALPSDFPKWRTVHSYFAIWSEPREEGSLLEQALKKSGWRGPGETGAQRWQHIVDTRRAEREEHGHGEPEGL